MYNTIALKPIFSLLGELAVMPLKYKDDALLYRQV